MSALLRFISRTDVYASGSVGGFNPNDKATYGGKWFEDKHLSTTGVNTIVYNQQEQKDFKQLTPGRTAATLIAIFAVPVLLIPAVGVVVLRRRKNK